MKVIFISVMYFIASLKIKADIVSEEKQDTESLDAAKTKSDLHHSRKLMSFDEKDWHVTELRDHSDDFIEEKKECKLLGRKRNDGGYVKYVSADPIPQDACDGLNKKNKNIALPISSTFKDNIEITVTNDSEETTTVPPKATAATVDPKASVKRRDKVKSARKASEYMFSSVEYYDDVMDFDEEVCPTAVEVIHLEVEQLRNYDLECERMVEWRSLD